MDGKEIYKCYKCELEIDRSKCIKKYMHIKNINKDDKK